MHKRILTLAGLLLAAACGGGGGTSVQTAALSGVVYQLDGQTQNRAGVVVRVLETGETIVTGPDGSFDFPAVPAGIVTLRFGSALAAVALSGEGGTGGGADDALDTADDNGGGGADDSEELEDEADDDVNGDETEIHGVGSGDSIEIRVALENGQVTEFSRCGDERSRGDARLARAEGSPDPDVEGKVKIESRDDREKITIEAEHLDTGTVVEFYMDDPATPDAVDFVLVGDAAANLEGEAEMERNTRDGDALPFDVVAVSELVGLPVEVRLASTGEVLLVGEVPSLPAPGGDPGHDGGGDEDSRGRALLTALQPGLEGHVEIRSRPDQGDRFKMEAEGLEPGTAIAFQIEDPLLPGTFLTLAGGTANSEGHAEYETEGGILPLGFGSAAEMVGLHVRVILDDGSDTVLLTGEIPALVED